MSGPYLPLPRTFRQVLPPVAERSSIAGWGDRVWFGSSGKLLEHDGKGIRQQALCGATHHPADYVGSGPNGIIAVQSTTSPVTITVITDAGRQCQNFNSESVGAHYRLAMQTRPRRTSIAVPPDARPLLGFAIPPPHGEDGRHGLGNMFFLGRAIWLEVVTKGAHVYRFDSGRWVLDNPPVGSIGDMWADPSGTVWAITGYALSKHDGSRWTMVPVPEGFRPRRMTGASAKDIWFVGGSEKIFQFDGAKWHRGTIAAPKRQIQTKDGPKMIDSPEGPKDIHMTRSGVLWLLTKSGRIYRAEP